VQGREVRRTRPSRQAGKGRAKPGRQGQARQAVRAGQVKARQRWQGRAREARQDMADRHVGRVTEAGGQAG
jgi:hypothetical protein